ncbi:MAG TPA: hypothetical protein VFM38_13450, partial [Candidatus Limnocylindrales bacterium]|nr:hypothetical protein [Candidatus Limnocylindrales bacterium]
MRLSRITLAALALPLSSFVAPSVFAQQPAQAQAVAQSMRQLTPQDYARAEKFLGNNTVPLVSGIALRPTWLEGGRFWYRATAPSGSAFMIVDPVRKTRLPLFDQTRLAAALASASGGRVEASRLA